MRPVMIVVAIGARAALAAEPATVDLRWQVTEVQARAQGPLAQASALAPGLVAMSSGSTAMQAELRHSLTLPWPSDAPRLRLGLNLLARHEWPRQAAQRDSSRVNELHLSTESGAFGFTAGKRLLGWDVGYAFRPNDVVQQEDRRSLAGTTPEGRPLVQAEWFGTDQAAALVWVNPQAHGRTREQAPGPQEPALAARVYQRLGTLDLHGFARWGERTAGSLGVAAAWVPGESTEWHASVRWLQRHEGWGSTAAPGAVLGANPWQVVQQGSAVQALVGLSWTGLQHQTLLAEAWYDGTALPNSQWQRWAARNAALVASPAPAPARAANLAWQATPLDATNLQRSNLLVRASWQPPEWQLWADVLWQPADDGMVFSAGAQWQGERWRISASLRHAGGARQAVTAQLPWQRQWLLAATFSL